MGRTRIRPDFGRCLECKYLKKRYKDRICCSVPYGEIYYHENNVYSIERFKDDFDMKPTCPERNRILEEYFKDKPKLRDINHCRTCFYFSDREEFGCFCRSRTCHCDPMSLDTANPVKPEWFEKLEIPTCHYKKKLTGELEFLDGFGKETESKKQFRQKLIEDNSKYNEEINR